MKSLGQQKYYLLFTILLFIYSTAVNATDDHFYLGAEISASKLTLKNNRPQINYYKGLLNDAYPMASNKGNSIVYAFRGGYEFTNRDLCGPSPAIALGLGFYTTLSNKYSYRGQLIETAKGDPSFALYNYTFVASTRRLMAETQFTWEMIQHFIFFLNAGIGAAWLQTNNYEETPVDNTGYTALPPFQQLTKTQLALQAGLGLGYMFNLCINTDEFQHERISIGYRYGYFGNAYFKSRGPNYPYQLNLGKVISNDIYLAYTHLF